jgi:very-short-patch-repair endonuclease
VDEFSPRRHSRSDLSGRLGTLRHMDTPFLGREALASGAMNRHQLRTRFRTLCPGVYVPRQQTVSLHDRIHAAWLWSQREGTVAGLAAAALHGARWIDDDIPVELVYSNARAPQGVLTRRDRLLVGEVEARRGLRLTTSARTAFDIGRRERLDDAVAHIDALIQATGLGIADVEALATQHPGARGLRRLECALELVDSGAQSPRESRLRLLLIRSGLPKPQTQIPVLADGRVVAYLDMGWPDLMVAVEYDGDQHRTDRAQYVKDIRRHERLESMGWIIVRVVAEDHPVDVIRRVRRALDCRSFRS